MQNRLHYPRVIATCVIWSLELLTKFIMLKSFYYQSVSGINSGVIVCFFTLKLIITTIAFNYLFNQKLKTYDYIGIILGILWVLTMTASHPVSTQKHTKTFGYEFLAAISLISISILVLIPRDIIMKKYFAYGQNNVNIVQFRTFHDVWFHTIVCLFGIYRIYHGLRVPFHEFVLITIGGFAHFCTSLVNQYLIMRSLAGAAETLIQSTIVIQVIIDAILFAHFPNIWQWSGIILALLSAIWIIVSNKWK